MDKNLYLSAAEFFSRRSGLLKVAATVQKALERAIYMLYPVFLVWLFWQKNDFWWKSAVVCFISLCAVSLLRAIINAERPYEKFGFEPLINREKGGKAFPSRHAFSGAIISLHMGLVFPAVGIVVGIMTLIIAFLRVVFGVHFIKDVLAGILCGVCLGLIVLIIK